MIASIDNLQEILAIDMITALKSFTKRKHVLRSLRLCGEQAANAWFPLDRDRIVRSCDPSKF